MIYQTYDIKSSSIMAFLMFIPQTSIWIITGFLFHYDIFFAMVIQTWTFVAFNKVMTAQYFLWYMSLMPFMMINNGVIHASPVKGLMIYLA